MDDTPTTEILTATRRALCEHGYADLTLRDVAAEAELCKSTIHYHYGTKEELFDAFLDALYERYVAALDEVGGDTPRERLDELLDVVLADDGAAHEVRTALFELQAQAPYDDDLRERLVAFDAHLVVRLREIIAAGVRAGEFDPAVDPDEAAECLATAVQGANTRRVAVDRPADRAAAAATRYVEAHLLTDDPTEVAP